MTPQKSENKKDIKEIFCNVFVQTQQYLKKCPWKHEKTFPEQPIWPKIENQYQKLGWGIFCSTHFVLLSVAT